MVDNHQAIIAKILEEIFSGFSLLNIKNQIIAGKKAKIKIIKLVNISCILKFLNYHSYNYT